MNIDPGFLDHWRTRMLGDALGGDELAPLYVMRLWAQCERTRSLRLVLSPCEVKSLCKYRDDPFALEVGLAAAGFFERDGDAIVAREWIGCSVSLAGPRRLDVSEVEWAALRAAVFERDSYTCLYCGACGVRLECDHVVPVSLGGASTMDNLATACLPCNRSKGAKTLSEWLPQLLRRAA